MQTYKLYTLDVLPSQSLQLLRATPNKIRVRQDAVNLLIISSIRTNSVVDLSAFD